MRMFLKKSRKFPACSMTPYYMKEMVTDCTKIVIACEAVGYSVCCNINHCGSGQKLTRELTCIPDTCSKFIIATNSDSYSISSNTNTPTWLNAESIVGQPRVEKRVVCSITGVEMKENAAYCEGKKKERIFSSLNYYHLTNGSQIIGTPDNFDVRTHVSRVIKDAFKCGPSADCATCYESGISCNGDDVYCKYEGINCDPDSPCFCSLVESGEREAFYETVPFGTMSSVWFEIESKTQVWSEVEILSSIDSERVRTDLNCKISSICSSGSVVISSSCNVSSLKILLCNRILWLQDKAIVDKKSISAAIPWDLILTNNQYEVTVYFENHSEKPLSYQGVCPPFRVCSRIDCIFCKENIQAPRCWTAPFVIAIFTLGPIALLLVLWLLAVVLLKIGCLRKTVGKTLTLIWSVFCPFHFCFLVLLKQLKKGQVGVAKLHEKIHDHHRELMGIKLM